MSGRHVGNFQPLSDKEHDKVQELLNNVLDTTPRVVSYDHVPLQSRRNNATYLKDVIML